ncbi:ATP-grasp domain-containing protein [Aminipila sp.]|uniref:ATP-grasp domain-containing protein n=1 Tax=Aminipila sp. TaxID=2060095 RepID=UPI001DCA27F3|nr:ATP-grasp domain-containing protein [Aminipila sp.]MBE6034881.1 ATP-grasp domain-containing protein [Clostridiales bacterium]
MKEINILITSAGRRVELIKCFQNAKRYLNITGNIVAADASETAPACFFADKKYQVCRIDDDKYIMQLIEICKNERIHLIVPTIDTELIKLSQSKTQIENECGAKVLISGQKVIDICRDKYKTVDFFLKNELTAPRYITKNDLEEDNYEFPLFIKPLNGSSSINAFKVHNQKELEFFTDYIENYILQDFVEGKEYTIDAFCDFKGNPITIVPRQRLAVRSGEILKGVTEKNQLIINEVKKVLNILKPIGQITLQGILNDQESVFSFIEINPRFGGGAPMSIAAGADSCINLYKLLLGETLTYNEEFEEGLLGIRFDQAIFINEKGQKK